MGPEEEAEFAVYVTARRDRVRRTAYLICGDWHRADDLTQIAFIKLYGAWQGIRNRAALDSFVRSCLVRAAVDESRRPWRLERAVEVLPEVPDVSDLSDLVADRAVIRQALEEVPPGQRVVLVLRYFEGSSVAEVARILDCSEGNVKSQTARGLAALKAALIRLGAVQEPLTIGEKPAATAGRGDAAGPGDAVGPDGDRS